jgi:hypothetical protein
LAAILSTWEKYFLYRINSDLSMLEKYFLVWINHLSQWEKLKMKKNLFYPHRKNIFQIGYISYLIFLDRIIYFPYWKKYKKFGLNYLLQTNIFSYGRIFSHTEQYFLMRKNIFCCSKIEKKIFLGVDS